LTLASWLATASALVVGCAATTVALIVVSTPALERYALARPGARSSHRRPTPQGGGAAIVVAVALGIVLAAVWLDQSMPSRPLSLVLGAMLVLAVTGALDDVFELPALPRLVVQFACAVAVVLSIPEGARVLPAVPPLVERGLFVLAFVWFVNLVNFMDGIDWITVAEVLPIAGTLAVLGILGAAPPSVAVAALALAGGMLGFAPFNRPVARLFLGDVGSLPIGLLLAWLLVLVAASGHLAAAILMPLYYLTDATLTLGRRLVRRERVWQAHRTHFYQRATDHGFTVMQIVTRIFLVNCGLGALALVSVWTEGAPDVGLVLAGALSVGWLLGSFTRARHRP
jgi:UDP-N-acetylmuramyl pentapeptide phosphotransferase/UDP-N-acetylglucosamine-1-phosphate transferase